MIKVEILDDDLRELILYGVNAGKYKRIARDKKFVKKLTDIPQIRNYAPNMIQKRK